MSHVVTTIMVNLFILWYFSLYSATDGKSLSFTFQSPAAGAAALGGDQLIDAEAAGHLLYYQICSFVKTSCIRC